MVVAIPIPIEVKNTTSVAAITQTSGLRSALKSGVTYAIIPSMAPGRVTALMTTRMLIASKPGIKMLFAFSKPPCRPLEMIT